MKEATNTATPAKTVSGYKFIIDDGGSSEQPAPTFMSRIPNPPSSVKSGVSKEDRLKAIDAYVNGKRSQLAELIK